MKIELINRIVDANLNWTSKDMMLYGKASSSRLAFMINKNLPLDNRKITFVHELIHMMSDGNSGIKNLTETQTDHLANELLYFLNHNKSVIKWITER